MMNKSQLQNATQKTESGGKIKVKRSGNVL